MAQSGFISAGRYVRVDISNCRLTYWLNRRDIMQNHSMIAKRRHYKMLTPATPPEEGNSPPLRYVEYFSTAHEGLILCKNML